MKLSVAVSDYLQARTVDGFAETTLAAYRLQFALLLRAIGDQELGMVTTVQLALATAGWQQIFDDWKSRGLISKGRCSDGVLEFSGH